MKTTKKLLSVALILFLAVSLFGCHSNAEPKTEERYIYLPTVAIEDCRNSGGHLYKLKYEYDSYGNIVKTEKFIKNLFYLRDVCIDVEYTYDENGNVLQEISQREDFCTMVTDGHMITKNGYTYTYENGNLIKKEKIPEKSSYIGDLSYRYEYDENGKCITVYTISDGVEEKTLSKKYDSNNRIIQKTEYNWFNGHNISVDKSEYTYDNQGRLANIEKTFNATEETSYSFKTEFFYDENGRLIKKTQKENGSASEDKIVEYKRFVKVPVNENSKKSFYQTNINMNGLY